MASVQSDSYDGRYLKLTVVEESTSIQTNTSTVRWTIESIGGTDAYYTIYNCSVVVNGQTVANYGTKYWDSYQFPAKKGSETGTITVPHNNDGTASPIGFTLNGKVYRSGTESHSGTLPLSTIPRYATCSQSVNSMTETTLKMNWTSDNICDYLWYTTNGDAQSPTWVAVGSINASSGSYTISGLTPGQQYNVKTKIRRKDSQLETASDNYSYISPNYPQLASGSNFTIGDGPLIQMDNQLNRPLNITVLAEDNSIVKVFDTDGQENTFRITFTQEENDIFYNSIPNKKSGTYKIKTISAVDTNTKNARLYSVNESESLPTFNDFEYADTNATTLALTGNSSILVQNYSNVTATVSTNNKASAKNGASMVRYNFIIQGNTPQSVDYSSSSSVSVTINKVANATLTLYAEDSRGLAKSVVKNATLKAYVPITKESIEISRQDNVGETVTLKFNGQFWGESFGSTTNTITNVRYRYKKTTDSDWPSTWNGTTPIAPTMSGNTYSFEGSIAGDTAQLGFDAGSSYNIEVEVFDELTSTTFSVTLGSGTPNMAFVEGGISLLGKYDENDTTNKLQINGNTKIVGNESVNGDVDITGAYKINGNPLNIPILDNSVSTSSTNGVENQAITNYVNGKVSNSSGTATDKAYSQNYVNTYISDTGWVDLSSYVNTANFAIRSDSDQFKPMARRIGKVVFWRGSIYCHTQLNAEQGTLLRNVPAQFMPNREVAGAGNHYNLNRIFSIWTEGRDIKINEGYSVPTTNFWQGYSLSCLGPYTID